MAVSPEYRDYVLDQLSQVRFDRRPMFGGVGLFFEGLMFGIISRSDSFYLKTDEETVGCYERRGSSPFMVARGGVSRPMGGYYEVPAEVLDDTELVAIWAAHAIDAARRTAAGDRARHGIGREKRHTKNVT
jgi:DNA transformation protein